MTFLHRHGIKYVLLPLDDSELQRQLNFVRCLVVDVLTEML
jgi:hypothetical protein